MSIIRLQSIHLNFNFLPLISGIGYGTSDFLVKKSSGKYSTVSLLFYSQLLGIPITCFFFGLYYHSLSQLISHSLPSILLACFDFISTLLLFRAFSKGNASLVSPILSSNIVVSLFISHFFLHQYITPIKLFLIYISFTGLLILATPDKFKSSPKGVPEAITAAILIGIYLTYWGHLTSSLYWPNIVLVNRLTLCLLSLPFLLISTNQELPNKNLWVLGLINALSQIITSLSYISTSGIVVTALLINSSPIFTLTLSQIFLHEKLTNKQWFAIFLILTSSLGCLV